MKLFARPAATAVLIPLSIVACLVATPVLAAENTPSKKATIDLAVSASQQAVNDLFTATLMIEDTGATPDDVAKRVSPRINEALRIAKAATGVTAKSGNVSTFPVSTGRGKIEGWRMRSEIIIESRDSTAFASLLGRLQTSLAVANIAFQPSPEMRTQAENTATLEGIAAFKARAKLVADSFGQTYRIRQLAVNVGGLEQPHFRAFAAKDAFVASAAAAPMPMEAGTSQVTVSIQGQIELE